MEPLAELPRVAEVRAVGPLRRAVEFTADALAARPAASSTSPPSRRRSHGVITRGLRGVALQLSPPFVTTEDELAAMVEGLRAGVLEVAGVRA